MIQNISSPIHDTIHHSTTIVSTTFCTIL